VAAYAIEHNAEIHSNDTDFARFPTSSGSIRFSSHAYEPLDAPNPGEASGGSAQHGDVVTQHQQFDILRCRPASEQHHQLPKLNEDQIKQPH
jgi:hypothetical protein